MAVRIREFLWRQGDLEQRATERAVEQLALSKEAVARELAGLAFARTGFEREDGRMDLSAVTGNCAAVLQVKRQSLMDLAPFHVEQELTGSRLPWNGRFRISKRSFAVAGSDVAEAPKPDLGATA